MGRYEETLIKNKAIEQFAVIIVACTFITSYNYLTAHIQVKVVDTLNDAEKREAVRQFCQKWNGRGKEDEDDRSYWLDVLQRIMGLEDATDRIDFQKKVVVDGSTKRIDAYIPETKVLIEQKTLGTRLDKKAPQSGGAELTPYGQAKRYNDNLPYSEKARWIVTCNFSEIWIYDMNEKAPAPHKVALDELQNKYPLLDFLAEETVNKLSQEMEVSIAAGEIVGLLYDALARQYAEPESGHALKSLNVLCVRLVFCLYAEDAGIFGRRGMFHEYLEGFDARSMRKAVIELFKTLDTKEEERDPYIKDDNPILASFPYVNGGLFAAEDVEIPPFTDEIRSLLLEKASADFDWSRISPTIFGAVFESTLNPETRRTGGMHYTSIENIHKVIGPLFLDGLEEELAGIKSIAVGRTRKAKLEAFQEKLAGLGFLDPACGSGNFLTETYISLRRLENEAVSLLHHGQVSFAMEEGWTPIKVSIGQFYGIEINDFAVTVAKTALWIAESQMMKETEDVVHMNLDFLPLKSYANIVEGNALRMDWNDVVPRQKLDYIMGNPPFLGGMYMSKDQKNEIRQLFDNVKGVGEFDYVTGWYKKAAECTADTDIQCAFVSTNSICQGSSVITFWKSLIGLHAIQINFAYTTFVWNNETKNQAKVHCIIIGFSGINGTQKEKKIYSGYNQYARCKHISPYLTDNTDLFVESRSTPICDVPKMRFGSMPRDGGGFILTAEERVSLIKKEPLTKKWIKPYIGAVEFLHNKERYCLWLVDAAPSEINKCPTVKKRIEHIRMVRESSKAAGTRKFAATPTLFAQIAQPDSNYIIVPKTSSGRRRYIPIGFMEKDIIASDLVFLIPNAGLYEFGILMSNVHNAWMRLVAGRLKSDYRYAKDIVYNNFPWPSPSEAQKMKIEQTAQEILDARGLYPNSSLADLYDPLTMPPKLNKAHKENDKAVMNAYGFDVRSMDENLCVAELMKMYQKMVVK